jgi:LPXTG-motif cell wall-anchored protein
VNGQFCKKAQRGTIGHSASGQALICATSNNPYTPQWRLATPAEVQGAVVLAATETPAAAADGSLPVTGTQSLTMALVAMMILTTGVVIRRRSGRVLDHRAWTKRIEDPYRPTWKPREQDDRWHW